MRLNLPANRHGSTLTGLVRLLPDVPTIPPPPPPPDPADPFALPKPAPATPLVGRFTAVVPRR